MKSSFLIIVFLTFSSFLSAQEYSGISKTYKIDSEVFKGEREIRVWVPHSYKASESNYPVIYLFDAQFDALFDMTTGISDYMSQTGLTSEYIVVGIKTENRPKEFTPTYLNEKTATDWGKESEVGNALLLETHLKNEVLPLVAEKYRVTPYRVGIGHSLGGTFVLNSVLTQPDLFNSIIAISPNVSYDDEQLLLRFENFLKQHKTVNKTIYVSSGTTGNMENMFKNSMIKLDSILEKQRPKGLLYTYDIFQDYNHSETPLVSISKGLTQISRIWNITEEKQEELLQDSAKLFVDDVKSFYLDLTEWAGFEVLPNANEINQMAYFCLRSKKAKEALGVLDWAIQLHPKDANLYDSKAEMLENLNQYKEAAVYYQKAFQILQDTKADYGQEDYDYYANMFKEHLEKVKSKK